MSNLIVLGDKTSHGGVVISTAPGSTTQGKAWAHVGDKVSCRRCKGIFPIIQGDASTTDEGRPVAYHGCKVGCGATLIASQMFTTTEPSGGAGPGAAGPAPVTQAAAEPGAAAYEAQAGAEQALPPGFGAIGAGLMARYEDQPLDAAGQRFAGRFQVLSRSTSQAAAKLAVRLRSTGGQYLTGATDAEGFTQWVERDPGEALSFDLPEPGQP